MQYFKVIEYIVLRTGLSNTREEVVPALKLIRRRRILGYVIPLLNLPLFLVNAYDIFLRISRGIPWNNPDFINDFIILILSLGISLFLPSIAPVYTSNYTMTANGLKITRFMKRTATLSYSSISRIDLYIRDEKKGNLSQDALKYSKESINELRRAGFRFVDYTNAESSIALIFYENKVYMISPAYPKVFSQKLKKKIGKLPIRIITLTHRGKRIQEQAP